MEAHSGIVLLLRIRDQCRKIVQSGGTPRPLFGIALLACAGILLGEWANGRFRHGSALAWSAGPRVGCAVFFTLAGVFAWFPRRIFCAAVVMAGFAALHLLRLNDPASIRLAGELASPSAAIDGGNEDSGEASSSARAAAQTLRARGVVLDEPRASTPAGSSVKAAGGKNWSFTLGLSFVEVHGRAWRCRARVSVYWRNGPETLAAGDRLELTGVGNRIAPARNPGEFDLAALLRRRDIRTEIRCSGIADVHRLPPVGWSWSSVLPGMARRFQTWTHARLTRGLEDDAESPAVLSTILLGLRSEPGLGELQEILQRTGTLHFFAIDGLKLGLIAVLFGRVLALCGLRRQWTVTLILPLLLAYALATGLGPASLRAVIVAAVLVGGEWIGRPVPPLNSLGAAATAILLFDTHQLFQLGFQLTFLVVLAILLLGVPLYRLLVRVGAPDPFLPPTLYSTGRRAFELGRRHVLGLVCVSCAASIGSLPVMLIGFHVVSPISLLANVLVFPLAFGMIALGILSLAVAGVSQVWAVWINNSNWLLAKAFLAGVRLCDAVPGGSFYAALPEGRWDRPSAEVTILDLPYGGRAIHVQAGGDSWLLDTGKPPDHRRIVVPFLRSRGVDRLAGLILTQPDGNHLGAAALVLAELAPGKLFDSAAAGRVSSYQRDFSRLAEGKKVPVTHWRRGDRAILSRDTEIRVLYPPFEGASGRTAGDKGLVLQLRSAGWRVLLLGDSGVATARALVRSEAGGALRSDVVVCGPAPASLDGVPELWRESSPRLAVLESGRENVRGTVRREELPAAATLSAAKGGAITLHFYPDRIETRSFLDGAALQIKR